uniref:Wsv021-like protein n=1 Tax=Penaeus monodon majanivirus B TaxID=2984272 RepID=A0A9C7C5C1_9VIRU|nr:MAG: wsv021-like protein [Penaeus monodon majanivirus B]
MMMMMKKTELLWPFVEASLFLMLILSVAIAVVMWYGKRHYRDRHGRHVIQEREKIYPIFLLDRNLPNGKVCVKECYLNIEEFILFTLLFRTIREFKPLTCKDDLGWYHYVYHISGCVFRDILWPDKKEDEEEEEEEKKNDADSTMFTILKIISSYEKNQLYVDYVYGLQKGEFDIIQNTNIRGDIKWMIQNVDDLVGDVEIIKR